VEITKISMAFTVPTPQLDRANTVIDLGAHERVLNDLSSALTEDQELIVQLLQELVGELKVSAQKLSASRELVEKTELQSATSLR
jgi:hypothetical protein